VAAARAIDTHAGDPVPLGDPHHEADTHQAIDGGADFGDHPDAGHRVDHPMVPPVDVSVKPPAHDTIVHETVIHESVVHDTPRQDLARHDLPAHDVPPHDSKAAADAALDNLLSTPVASGLPHGNDAAAPIGQSEPSPSHELDKPAHPHHADDPLLVDSREPGDPAGHHHDHPKKTVDVGAPLPDDFAAPVPAKPEEHHRELKEHEHAGPKDAPKDDFAMPAPTSAAPLDVPPPKEDVHHHPHHSADHGPADSPFGGEPSPTPGKDADGLPPKLDAPLPDAGHGPKPGPEHADHPHHDDPLLDVDRKLDGPPKDTPPKDGPVGLPPKSAGDKIEVSKRDHPDDGLPVLSVPSPHKPEAKLNDEPPKSDAPKMDDLGPPARTANASDASPSGGLGVNGAPSGNNLPPKPPESKAPAGNGGSLDDLLNSKVPTSGSPSAAPATKPAPPTAPAAAPKDDPFHTDSAVPTDSAPHAGAPPKQAEPAPAEIVAPTPKPAAAPAHPVDTEDALPSVAVAHRPIEKDETGTSVHYKIVVRNNGKKSVKSFEVDEAVPADHTVQVTDPPAETRAQDLHWTLHDVAPGEERTIVVTLAPPTRPVETPVAAQPVPIASATHAPATSDAPQLKLELITPVEVHAGETCRIGFRATNLGGQTTDLKVNLDLPQQLRYARGQQLQYKITALGDHEAREDYLTATATGTGQVELRAELLHAGHSVATAKGTCHVAAAGAAKGGIQQTGAWVPSGPTRTANGSDCQCWP
jgi:hypothetical protein